MPSYEGHSDVEESHSFSSVHQRSTHRLPPMAVRTSGAAGGGASRFLVGNSSRQQRCGSTMGAGRDGSALSFRSRSMTPSRVVSANAGDDGETLLLMMQADGTTPLAQESSVMANYREKSARRFSTGGGAPTSLSGYHPKYAARIGMNGVNNGASYGSQSQLYVNRQRPIAAYPVVPQIELTRPLDYTYRSYSTPRLSVQSAKTTNKTPSATTASTVYSDQTCGQTPSTHSRKRLDSEYLLNYRLPDASFTRDIKTALNSVNQKMAEHRSLIDRYASTDLSSPSSAGSGIEGKYQQMLNRMPELSRISTDDNTKSTSAYSTAPFTMRSNEAANSRMKINRIMSRCR